MSALVITSCTNRKRLRPEATLRGSLMSPGEPRSLAREWVRRLRDAEATRAAGEIYCGRGFREAEAAAERMQADLFIVSAGVGLVSAQTRMPSYSLTIAPGSPDDVVSRLAHSSAADWWTELVRWSPFSTPIAKIVGSYSLILIALPATYLRMVSRQLEELPAGAKRRLRVFTRTPNQTIPKGLSPYVMPYDARFDGDGGPLPGTHADFSQRALHHFVRDILPRTRRGGHVAHAEAVEDFLSGLRPPRPLLRKRLGDEEITALINRYWHQVQGQSGLMLRLLRDKLHVACEQTRFRDLFRGVRAERSAAS